MKWLPRWIFPVVLVLAAVTVWVRLAVVRSSYDIHQNGLELRALKQKKEQLLLREATLRSPRRLESLARGSFQLSPPRVDQIVRMQAAPIPVESQDAEGRK